MNSSHIVTILAVIVIGGAAFYFPAQLSLQAEQQAQFAKMEQERIAREAEAERIEELESDIKEGTELLQTLAEVEVIAQHPQINYWPITLKVLLERLVSQTPVTASITEEFVTVAREMKVAEPAQALQDEYQQVQAQFESSKREVSDLRSRFDLAFKQFSDSPGALTAVDFLEFCIEEKQQLETETAKVEHWLETNHFDQVVSNQTGKNRTELEEAARVFRLQAETRIAALKTLEDLANLVATGINGQLPSFKKQLEAYRSIVRAYDHQRNVLVTGFAYVFQMHQPGKLVDWKILKNYYGAEPLIPDLDTPEFSEWQNAEQWESFILQIERELRGLSWRQNGGDTTVAAGQAMSQNLEWRQDLFRKISDLERKATTAAIVQFPADAAMQSDLEERLRERYLSDLARQFELTKAKLDAIHAEGVRKNWDF